MSKFDKINQFLDSKGWREFQCLFILTIFVYELTVSIGRLPGGRPVAGIIFWSLCIFIEILQMVSILKGQ